jgi:hypothetical protein
MWIMTTLLGTKNGTFRNARKVSTMPTKPCKPTLYNADTVRESGVNVNKILPSSACDDGLDATLLRPVSGEISLHNTKIRLASKAKIRLLMGYRAAAKDSLAAPEGRLNCP